MKQIARDIYDFINGIYSNIPVCCVLYWIKRQRNTDQTAYEVALERGKTLDGSKPFYVACNKCHKVGKIHELKRNGSILNFLLIKE